MTNTVAQAIAYAEAHPQHYNFQTKKYESWNNWCAALVFNAGGFSKSYTSAQAAYNAANKAGRIYSPTKVPSSKVPNGWIVFWDYGAFGHVGIQTPKGCLMASGYITSKASSKSQAVGFIRTQDYASKSGHRYLGATPYWGASEHLSGISLSLAAPKPAAPKPSTSTWTLAKVSKTLQEWARRGGYDGPIDGKLGVNSWKGVQTLLKKSYGYDGPIDGKPGKNTYSALQRLAKKGGYSGPVDGVMGTNSWHGVAKALGQSGA